ncbi:Transcriptional regulator, LysR family [Pseudoalteromonas luteoviolacea B = ATCC 29581]|nr:Transcriptional regulator, LysR family [Pseudoalteromonas luteoviolacea B = ATCC 29581]
MLRVTLEQWRMFQAVVEYGGFNQAAVSVHKSQSSIHTAVHKIESALGVKLFRIEGRRTVLTDAGELMLKRANYLLNEAAKVEAVGTTLAEGIETSLRIAVDEILPNELLYRSLEQTSAEFPLLRIELIETILNGSSELLEDDRVDIAIAAEPLLEGFSEELCELEFIAVSSPNHPLQALGRDLTLEDLKLHRQIVIRDSATQEKRDAGWLGAEQRWTVSHLTTSIEMIKSGLGFAWLPEPAIAKFLGSNALKALPLLHNGRRSAQLFLVFKDGDRLGPAARRFVAHLRLNSLSCAT